MRIENLKRDLSSRAQEMSSLHQVKDSEAKNLKRNFERQLKDKEEDLKILETQ